jgi:hypothetical protein
MIEPMPAVAEEHFRRVFAEAAEQACFETPKEVTDCAALLRYAFRRATDGRGRFLTASGQWRDFADAEQLMRFNTVALGLDLRAARPADLLFYRQLVEGQAWHSMVWLGASTMDGSKGPYVVYHSGTEMRRPPVAELLRHPEPRWRPVTGNPNFLGVFRWKLLAA